MTELFEKKLDEKRINCASGVDNHFQIWGGLQ
jgi:hypothetical protein